MTIRASNDSTIPSMSSGHVLLAVFTGLFLLAGCSGPATKPETLVEQYDEAEMGRAIATARSKVGEFLAALEKGDADSFSVKAPITDPNGTEHFWITDVTFKDGSFTGLIGNDPGVVRNVRYGQSWTIKQDEISDWMFLRGEKIHGGFTIDPLLPTFPKDKADALRAQLVR